MESGTNVGNADTLGKLEQAHADAGLAHGEPVKKAPLALMTKDDIVSTVTREYKTLDMSKFWPGKSVRIQSLTAGERDEWEASYVTERKDGTKKITSRMVRAGLVGRCLVDGENKLMFEPEEITILQHKHAGAIDYIFTACADMNGITEQDIEEIKGN